MPQISTKKVTVSLPEDLIGYADHRASELGKTRSDVIGQLLAEHRQRWRDGLAREGYEFFAQEAGEFAEASSRAVAEAFGDERPPR